MRWFPILLVMAACAMDGSDPEVTSGEIQFYPSAGATLRWTILPSDTSLPGYGAIGGPCSDAAWCPDRAHYVYRPPVAPLQVCQLPCPEPPNKLVVVFPGCGGSPSAYTEVMEVAFAQGYHVIGLDYPNECGQMADFCTTPGCFGRFRDEVAFADAHSNNGAALEGHLQDAITKRLKALLLELEERDPNGKWGLFLDQDASAPDGLRPHYSRIVLAGHSLGSGYAAYIAQEFAAARVVMIAGPTDGIEDYPGDTTPTAPSWIGPGATQASRFWGLTHPSDFVYYKALLSWSLQGLPASQRLIGNVLCLMPNGQSYTGHNATAQCPNEYWDEWIQMFGTP